MREKTLAALVAAALVASLCGATARSAGPLTNEDVVKMTARHESVESILEAIRSAPTTSFDMDPDVIVEMKRAGVADVVIDAMRARSPVPSPRAAPKVPQGSLQVLFSRQEGADPMKSTAVLPAKNAEGRPISVAFYVLCTDPLHAPDHWTSQTQLSVGFPRHHLIWLLDQTSPYGEGKHGGLISLALPEKQTLTLEAGVHAIVAGVAARIGDDPWAPVASAQSPVEIWEGRETTIVVELKTRSGAYSARGRAGTSPVTCSITEVRPPEGVTEPAAPQP